MNLTLAQKKLEESAKKISLNRKRKDDHRYLLSGLLKCGYCSSDSKQDKNSWNGMRDLIDKNSNRYSYSYICGHKNTRKYSDTCPTIPIPADPIETFILDFAKRLLRDPRALFEYQTQLKSNKQRVKLLEKERDAIQKQLNLIPQRISKLSVQHEIGMIKDQEVSERMENIETEKHNLTLKLLDINKILGEQQLSQGYVDSFKAYSEKYRNIINELSTESDDLYNFIHGIIEEIIIKTRPFDSKKDKIAGRKKANQQIPESITVKIKLPQELTRQLTTQYITPTEFDVKTVEL